jgi:hypothetical protein
METQFILTNYFTDPSNNIKNLYDKFNIMSKNYPEYNMIILYNNYNTKHRSKLELECRSVIIDQTTSKIICYSCPTPYYNNEALKYIKHCSLEKEYYVCYEGSLLSVFYNNGWFVASRKCIYNSTSEQTGKYKMFMDVLKKDGYDFDSFTNTLDKLTSYNFVLIHHLNENIVNYKKEFGEEYTKLCFIGARKQLVECTVDFVLSENIFLAKKLDSMTQEDVISDLPTNEGLIVKIKESNTLLKIQSKSYLFHKAIGSERNMFHGFLFLYQNNLLNSYLENPENNRFKQILNPLNTMETFDVGGIINCLFKVLTSEFIELYNLLYDAEGNQQTNTLYNYLPQEYKNILFKIKGIQLSNIKKGNEPIGTKNINHILKVIDVTNLVSLIKDRKLMLNWIRLDIPESKLFLQSLYKCPKIFYKLASIYTIKLFPEIMPTDMPKLKQ